MSLITNQNAELPQVDTNGQVGHVNPVDQIDPEQSDQFSDLVAKDEQKVAMEGEAMEGKATGGEISPEELQRQIRENLFKNGFNKAMEKAKEISKELRNG